MTQRTCIHCDASFMAKRSDARFCSAKCGRQDYYLRNREKELAQNSTWVASRANYRRDQSRRLNADEMAERAKALADRLADSHKTCSTCRDYLPKTDFYEDPRRGDGLYSRCKLCQQGAQSRWVARNPETLREYASWRRAKAGERISYPDILAEHGMFCHICRHDIAGMDVLHFDHVVPLARDGEHTADNIRPSHARCNLRKGSKLMAELAWAVA